MEYVNIFYKYFDIIDIMILLDQDHFFIEGIFNISWAKRNILSSDEEW